MELSLSGSALRTFHRSVTCLARIGSELVLESSPSQLVLHTLNSSRSAYQSITLKPDFFDVYALSAPAPVQCSVLLKAVCSVLRTQIAGIDRLSVSLPSPDANKLQFSLGCHNGVKKTYWITCNVEPDIQHLSLDRRKFPSSLVVRPRDLSRLLSNFQSLLQEITLIATEPGTSSIDDGGEIGGKAVEIRSYIDPNKDNTDATLHTQLWIDPAEEFLQYNHTGDPVDVTFSVKELKAFLSFCEGCEVDIHLFFEKAGEPILMAPKFGIDGVCTTDFDSTLVLATMLISQLQKINNPDDPNEPAAQALHGDGSRAQHGRVAGHPVATEHPSDHTKTWSELSGGSTREKRLQTDGGQTSGAQNAVPTNINGPELNPIHMQADKPNVQDGTEVNGTRWTQNHPSNWVGEEDDEEEDGEGEFVQSTPPY